MGRVLVKPDLSEDFYVEWSTIAEAPVRFGDRAYLHGFSAQQIERCDATGSSSEYDGLPFIYEQQGLFTAANARVICERLAGDERTDVGDLLDPLEEE